MKTSTSRSAVGASECHINLHEEFKFQQDEAFFSCFIRLQDVKKIDK